jgi:hypothetical protein
MHKSSTPSPIPPKDCAFSDPKVYHVPNLLFFFSQSDSHNSIVPTERRHLWSSLWLSGFELMHLRSERTP